MSTPQLATITAITEHVSCVLGQETVILQLQNGQYYGLNEVGSRVWELIQQPRTTEEIETSLLEEFDVAQDRCREDLASLLQDMAAAGLVQISPSP